MKLFRNWQPHQRAIVIVSGLPRSGTSLMMQMLQQGGLPILTDHVRLPDANNVRGYYEYEAVKRLHKGDTEWLQQAYGQAVKVVSPLLIHLPPKHTYRVIFMRRALAEIIASQRTMLERLQQAATFDANQTSQHYQQHLLFITHWLKRQSHIQTLFVDYAHLIQQPLIPLQPIRDFIGVSLNLQAMQNAIDPKLYRERT